MQKTENAVRINIKRLVLNLDRCIVIKNAIAKISDRNAIKVIPAKADYKTRFWSFGTRKARMTTFAGFVSSAKGFRRDITLAE
jgi:hypothetical protein